MSVVDSPCSCGSRSMIWRINARPGRPRGCESIRSRRRRASAPGLERHVVRGRRNGAPHVSRGRTRDRRSFRRRTAPRVRGQHPGATVDPERWRVVVQSMSFGKRCAIRRSRRIASIPSRAGSIATPPGMTRSIRRCPNAFAHARSTRSRSTPQCACISVNDGCCRRRRCRRDGWRSVRVPPSARATIARAGARRRPTRPPPRTQTRSTMPPCCRPTRGRRVGRRARCRCRTIVIRYLCVRNRGVLRGAPQFRR
jgi:hypothetical protein